MKVIFKIFSAFVVLAVSACAGPLDNSYFISGPSGEMGSGSDSGEVVPDKINFDQVKVISFNVRTATAAADKNTDNAWDKRKAATPALIIKENPTVFGVQEAIREQVDYINGELSDYAWVGVSRDDGEREGKEEFMAIFYKKSDVEIADEGTLWGTFWLSESPDVPSKGWDSEFYRTATWAVFNHKATGKQFLYINTHLDHEAQTARKESIKLICEKISALRPTGQTPVVITADFNSETSDAIFDPLKALMSNAREYSSATDSYATFNGWGTSNGRKIDHIFYSPDGFKSLQYRTIRERYAGVLYVSDHFPISALLEFKDSETAQAVAGYASAPQTRVSFTENTSFNELQLTWNPDGESFSVFSGTASQTPATFVQTGVSADAKEASFAADDYTLTAGNTYYAVYPALSAKTAPSSLSFDLTHQDGTSYEAGADKTFMFAEAVCEDADKPLDFRFRHLTAAMRLDIVLPDGVTASTAEGAVVSAKDSLLVSASYSVTNGRLSLNSSGRVKGDIILKGPFQITEKSGKKTMTVYFRMFQATVENLEIMVLIDGTYYVADIFSKNDIIAGNWYYTAEGKEVGETVISTLKVMSFNVRTATVDDGIEGILNGRAWSVRKSSMVSLLKKESPDVFGVQEATIDQVNYLKERLTDYGYYGVGRDDGANGGEIMAIFYKKSVISLGNHGTFWLSETPDAVSKGWGANYYRTATWAEFTHIVSGEKFFHLNTHLDHETSAARTNSVTLICEKLEELNPSAYPAVVTGDFNAKPDDKILDPLEAIMSNTRVSSSTTDDSVTYNAYGDLNEDGTAKARIIDHIFISSGFRSMEYKTVTDKSSSGKYISDHYPIYSLLKFE